MNMMNFTKTVLGNLFSKPVTRGYPFEPRQYQERTRGQIGIDIEDCIFCGMCQRKCPTSAIAVDKARKSWTIERFGCIQCGNCVIKCPKKCLHMLNDYTTPAAKKYEDSYAQPMPEPTEEPAVEAKTEGTEGDA